MILRDFLKAARLLPAGAHSCFRMYGGAQLSAAEGGDAGDVQGDGGLEEGYACGPPAAGQVVGDI